MLGTLRDLCEGFVFDPSFIDLVVAYPYLTWDQFGTSLAVVASWKWTTERVERFLIYRARRLTAWGLLRLALFVRPAR